MHHVEVHVAVHRMAERARHGADDLEAAALPGADGAAVGADDRVELHGPDAERPGATGNYFLDLPALPLALLAGAGGSADLDG